MNFRIVFRKYGTLFGLLLAVIFFSVATPYFLTMGNIMSLLRQVAITAVMAIGSTAVVTQRGFDMSIGSICGLTTVVVATNIGHYGSLVAVLLGLGVALLFSLGNVIAIIYLRISGIIATLATMFIGIGLESQLSGGGRMVNINVSKGFFVEIGRGFVGPVPVPVIIVIVMTVIFYVFMQHTKTGRYISAAGDNPMAAVMSGINLNYQFGLAYVLSGVTAGMGGIMWASRVSSAIPGTSQVYLLDSIAAIFIGATILREGRPHIVGSVLGAIFMGIVTNGTSMLGFTVASQSIFKGGVLLLAVTLTALIRQKELRTVFS